MTAKTRVHLSRNGQRLSLEVHGATREFAALWLRERAPTEETLDPRTGQRLIEAAELPLDLALETGAVEGDRLLVRFSDGCVANFALSDLTRPETESAASAFEGDLWDASLKELPQADFAGAVADDRALFAMLEQLQRRGFVLVSGVPTEADGMQPLIDRIGPLRRTNWGGIADVKSVPNAYDLTMTQRGLEPHTDNPYRDPIPGYIWLHCLTNASESGDNTLVDGYRAALELKRTDPDAFACLTTVWPTFRYRDDDTYLQSEGPLIELNSQGLPARIRFSNRTERVPALDPDLLAAYFAARQAFYQLITSAEFTVNLKLEPGQMLIMDNYRLLHGRKAFQLSGGVRHLRQGYVDRDSTASRREVLRQRLEPSIGQEQSA